MYGSCNVADETEDLNLKVFNMIARKNEVKTLVSHISCDCTFGLTTYNSNQNCNSHV